MNSALASKLAGLACLASLSACAPASGPASQLTMADVQPILKPLVLRDVVDRTCGGSDRSAGPAFLADLKTAGAPDALIEKARAEADRIKSLDPVEPGQSICTPEFRESSDTMALAARMAWADLKHHKP